MAQRAARAADPGAGAGLGALLRGHRLAAGLSQAALAERAALSDRAVGDLERGKKTRPHPNTLRRLADALALLPPERAALAAAARPPTAGAPRVAAPPGPAG